MRLTDFIIIYLACGAPFGVYYFFQQRETLKNSKLWQNSTKLWLKCAIISLFWFLYAFKLLHGFITKKLHIIKFGENNQPDSTTTEKIEFFEQEFSQLLLQVKTGIPLFHFRDAIQSYVGLTLECTNNFEIGKVESHEFFEISTHENPELATICLNRRNRLRLEQHQTLARKDFLRIIEKLKNCGIEKQKLSTLVMDFANFLKDSELKAKLGKLFENSSQTPKVLTVKDTEDEIWKTEITKQSQKQDTILNLQTMSATATTLTPD